MDQSHCAGSQSVITVNLSHDFQPNVYLPTSLHIYLSIMNPLLYLHAYVYTSGLSAIYRLVDVCHLMYGNGIFTQFG